MLPVYPASITPSDVMPDLTFRPLLLFSIPTMPTGICICTPVSITAEPKEGTTTSCGVRRSSPASSSCALSGI
nr:MAG TPA: hypothetical protein [Caudoviricetes sp.]